MSMKVNNPDKFRSNIVKKFESLLEDNKKAVNLERSIFNYAIQ